MKKISSIILITFLFLSPVNIHAIEMPDTLEEAGQVIEDTGWELSNSLPEESKKIWKDSALPIIKRTIGIIKNDVWPILKNFFNNMFPNLKSDIENEIENRQPYIEGEFENEKEEVKEELPVVTKKFWEKLKEILE